MTEAERMAAEASSQELMEHPIYQGALKLYGMADMKKAPTRHDLYIMGAAIAETLKSHKSRMDAIEDQLTRPGS